MDGVIKVYKADGIPGLFRGVEGAIPRVAVSIPLHGLRIVCKSVHVTRFQFCR